MHPIPVTVLTGFLGSGKTTFLNDILRTQHGQRIAVIVNEFGEISIDQELVVGVDDAIFEINNGCLCCTVRGDLLWMLNNLKQRSDKLDRVVIETTGLAHPGPVAQTFFTIEEVQSEFALDGVVTLIDAKHIDHQLATSEVAQQQVIFGDALLLNKVGLVSPPHLEAIENRLQRLNPAARIVRYEPGQTAPEALLHIGGFDVGGALARSPHFLAPEYPFDWGAWFELESGAYTLNLDLASEPRVDVMLLPVSAVPGCNALDSAADQAFRQFASQPVVLIPGDRLHPGAARWQLRLDRPGAKTFTVSIAKAGAYAMFLQGRPDTLTSTSLLRASRGESIAPVTEQHFHLSEGHHHDEAIQSVHVVVDEPLNFDRIDRCLQELSLDYGDRLLRMKGVLHIAGRRERFVFHGVHGMFDGRPDRLWRRDEQLQSRLVFIGQGLSRRRIEEGIRCCVD